MPSVRYSSGDFRRFSTEKANRNGSITTTIDRKAAESRNDLSVGDVVVFRVMFNPLHVGRIVRLDDGRAWATVLGSDEDAFGHRYRRGEETAIDLAFASKVNEDGSCHLEYEGDGSLEGMSVSELLTSLERQKEEKRRMDEEYAQQHKCSECLQLATRYLVGQYACVNHYNDAIELVWIEPGSFKRNIYDQSDDAHCCYKVYRIGNLIKQGGGDATLRYYEMDYRKRELSKAFYTEYKVCVVLRDVRPVEKEDAEAVIQKVVSSELAKFDSYIDDFLGKLGPVKSKTALAKRYKDLVPGKKRLLYMKNGEKQADIDYLWTKLSEGKV